MLDQLIESKDPQMRQAGQVLIGLEYENLVTALNFALEAQVSVDSTYFTLSAYLDAMQDQRRGLELGQSVLVALEGYPSDKLTGQLGVDFVGVIDNIAMRQLALKQYPEAESSYHKALTIWLDNKSYDTDTIKKRSATIYHQLGYVATERRQWEQAEEYYQQALQIYIEYNDRYEQASTYHQLGRVAEEQLHWEQAREYYLKALEAYIAFNDTHNGNIVLRSLAGLWKAGGDATLPAAVAPILGYSVEETEKLFGEVLEKK